MASIYDYIAEKYLEQGLTPEEIESKLQALDDALNGETAADDYDSEY